MSGEPVSEHIDVGAYALGLLEPADRRAFEEHLAGCPACAADLAELSGLKDLLTGLGPVPSVTEELAEAEVVDLGQRRRARWRIAISAAAAVVLFGGGGVVIGRAIASQPAPSGPSFSATSPVSQVKGTVVLTAKTWGTMITLDLFHLAGPLDCQIVAVSRTGERQVLGSWQVPPHAHFGLPGHPAPLVIEGPSGIKISDMSRVDINVVNSGVKNGNLVSIPTPVTR